MSTTSRKLKQIKPVIQEPLVYVGPSTKYIESNTTFTEGIPASFIGHIENCPCIQKLFVPINKLVEAQKQLKTTDSALSLFYTQANKYFEGVKH